MAGRTFPLQRAKVKPTPYGWCFLSLIQQMRALYLLEERAFGERRTMETTGQLYHLFLTAALSRQLRLPKRTPKWFSRGRKRAEFIGAQTAAIPGAKISQAPCFPG